MRARTTVFPAHGETPTRPRPAVPALAALLLSLAVPLVSRLPAAPAPADDRSLLEGYRTARAPFGALRWRGGMLSSRPDRVEAVAERLREVEEELGRRLARRITVVLVPDRLEFQRIAGAITGRTPSRWTLGMAFPARRWILVREDDPFAGMRPWERPEVTLAHELAHLLIHRPRRDGGGGSGGSGGSGGEVPRWFDEGVAMLVSQRRIPAADEARLSGLARLGGLFPVRDLVRRFPRLHQPGSIAYQQSLLMVTFLVERHGARIVGEILDRLEAGDTFEAAYEASSGESWTGFEPAFRAWIVSRHSLLSAIASLVGVWTLIALLAVVAIIVEGVRRRRAFRRLEELEALEERAGADLGDGAGGDPLAGA